MFFYDRNHFCFISFEKENRESANELNDTSQVLLGDNMCCHQLDVLDK